MALGTSLEMTVSLSAHPRHVTVLLIHASFQSKIYQSMGFEQKGFRVTPSPWKDWTNYVLMRRTAP